jgi:hypothetical protein
MMKRTDADTKLDKVLAYIRKAFPEEDTCFGLVLIVKTDIEPDGELAFGGTMTLSETGDVIAAYVESGGDDSVEESMDDDDDDEGEDTPPPRTLN